MSLIRAPLISESLLSVHHKTSPTTTNRPRAQNHNNINFSDLQKEGNGTDDNGNQAADLNSRGGTSEGWLGWLDGSSCGWGWDEISIGGWGSVTVGNWSSESWLSWDWAWGIDGDGLLSWDIAGSLLGWLDEPNNWGGVDNGGDGLAESSGGGGVEGNGGTWEGNGGVGVAGSWVWGDRWLWLDAVTGQGEDLGLSIDDIGVGAIDEV